MERVGLGRKEGLEEEGNFLGRKNLRTEMIMSCSRNTVGSGNGCLKLRAELTWLD